ncbi:hypothetical protein Esti_003435 [Eimeria stiedai]
MLEAQPVGFTATPADGRSLGAGRLLTHRGALFPLLRGPCGWVFQPQCNLGLTRETAGGEMARDTTPGIEPSSAGAAAVHRICAAFFIESLNALKGDNQGLFFAAAGAGAFAAGPAAAATSEQQHRDRRRRGLLLSFGSAVCDQQRLSVSPLPPLKLHLSPASNCSSSSNYSSSNSSSKFASLRSLLLKPLSPLEFVQTSSFFSGLSLLASRCFEMEAFGIGEETTPAFSARSSPRSAGFTGVQFGSQLSGPLTTALTQQLSFAESAATPGDLGRQLTRQLTRMMNRGADAEYTDESPRGEEHSPLVYYLGARLLRSGLLTQAFALAMQILIFLVFGGNGWFNANPFAAPDALKGAAVYVHLSAFLEVAFLVGVVQVAAFQVLIADNSKFTLGFRSGSKLLACAVSLDVAAAALRVAASLHFCRFVSARWLGRNMQLSGEWCLSYLGATLQGLALLSYGLAFAALELYHDKGVGDNHAWAMLVLYPFAGIAKLGSIYLSLTSLSPLLLLASLLAAYRWARAFEPLLERWSPELHARRLDDSILPNPRTVAYAGEEGVAQAGERYTYAAIPAAGAEGDSAAAAGAAAPGAASFQALSSRASFARAGVSFERGASAASSLLPTTYDYEVLQQQIREHEQAQRQPQQQ